MRTGADRCHACRRLWRGGRACQTVILGAGLTVLEEGATILPGLEQLVGPEDIDSAASSLDPGDPPVLQRSLRPEAAERIADYTRESAGSFLAVALNGQVVSAPMIASTIEGGVIQLEGTEPTEFAAFAPCFGR